MVMLEPVPTQRLNMVVPDSEFSGCGRMERTR